ncbi:MAG: SDR family NAD(P)-dependent oxidoreductase [SAR202 cluster bacterium]|nr:SDR family NAD(P)-dependent oxidoreductase [SAR202 cluster bacterium]
MRMARKDVFDRSGKVAIVTGTSSGLGTTFAQAMGQPTLAVRCDITDPAQVESMVTKTLRRFCRVDVLLNNAGGVFEERPDAEQVTDKGFKDTVQVNLLGTWYSRAWSHRTCWPSGTAPSSTSHPSADSGQSCR